MKRPDSPLAVYMRHIAHANHIILKEVMNNLNQNNNEQRKFK